MTRGTGLIVVAAGSSRRMGGVDKVWEVLGPHPVLAHALLALAPLAACSVLVVRADLVTRARREVGPLLPGLEIVAGGKERQDSVRNGLARLEGVDAVAIHDAARPFAPPGLLVTGVSLLTRFAGAIPVVPVHDTLKRVDESGKVLGTIDRGTVRAAQTPQIFQRKALVDAIAKRVGGAIATDEASLMEAAGYEVVTYPGSAANIKITTPFDLQVARMMTEQRRG